MRRSKRWLPWIVRVLYQPDIELDLLDPKGKPDHGKAVGLFVFVVFVVLLALKILPASVAVVIVLIAGAYGPLMFRTFLRSRTVTAHEELINDERPEVRAIDNPDAAE